MPVRTEDSDAAVPAANETGLPYLSYRTTQNLSTLFTSAEHATESSLPAKASGHSYEALAQTVDGGTFGYIYIHTYIHTHIHMYVYMCVCTLVHMKHMRWLPLGPILMVDTGVAS